MKDTIFISHANPENNYFATWLASKLKLAGYKVWVDLNDIKPGHYFNSGFEKIIREEAIRFIAVVSNEYVSKTHIDDSGVMNEILCARTIKDIEGFIIPLKYDNSNYDDFTIGLRGRQAISFHENWATGLGVLLKFLEEIKVPKSENNDHTLQFWQESQKINVEPVLKQEKYITNWLPVQLPENIYVHQPDLFIDVESMTIPYRWIKESDRLITFASRESIQDYMTIRSSFKLETADFIAGNTITIDSDFQLIEPNKKLVRLINGVFKGFLFEKHMKVYSQSGTKQVFLFPYSKENMKPVSLKQIGKNRRAIMGNTTEFTWHFAISHAAVLQPFPYLRITYTLIFTDFKGKFLDTDEQHNLRRSVPSDWFNRKWLETFLAMMLKLSNFSLDNLISIPVDKRANVVVSVKPFEVSSEIGYNEPINEI